MRTQVLVLAAAGMLIALPALAVPTYSFSTFDYNPTIDGVTYDSTWALRVLDNNTILGGSRAGEPYLSWLSDTSASSFTHIDPPAWAPDPAMGVNSAGDVVGGQDRAYLISGGITTELIAPGGTYTAARDINDAGEIAGFYRDPVALLDYGFLRSSGGDYTTLAMPGAVQTFPMGLNNTGQIVGSYRPPGTLYTPGFFYSAGSFYLVDVVGAMIVDPNDINDLGWIIGSIDAGNILHGEGLLYADGAFYSFTYPGGYPTAGFGIDNLGRIVGRYTVGTGEDPEVHGFLAVPVEPGEGVELTEIEGSLRYVPEPVSLAMLGLSLMGLGGYARRRIRGR